MNCFPNGTIDNMPALVQVTRSHRITELRVNEVTMSDTLRRSGKKSLPEQRMTRINQRYMKVHHYYSDREHSGKTK